MCCADIKPCLISALRNNVDQPSKESKTVKYGVVEKYHIEWIEGVTHWKFRSDPKEGIVYKPVATPWPDEGYTIDKARKWAMLMAKTIIPGK